MALLLVFLQADKVLKTSYLSKFVNLNDNYLLFTFEKRYKSLYLQSIILYSITNSTQKCRKSKQTTSE